MLGRLLARLNPADRTVLPSAKAMAQVRMKPVARDARVAIDMVAVDFATCRARARSASLSSGASVGAAGRFVAPPFAEPPFVVSSFTAPLPVASSFTVSFFTVSFSISRVLGKPHLRARE